MLFQVGYLSVSAQPQTTEVINKIVGEAREFNEQVGVTGQLICASNRFFQVLEGPRVEVEAILERIERDQRHHSVVKMFCCKVGSRDFDQWSMAIKLIPGQETQILGRRFLEIVSKHLPTGAQAQLAVRRLLRDGFQHHA